MKEIFEKVHIKSDEDLPESGWYFTDKGMQYYFSKGDNKWCDNVSIDWYLRPIDCNQEVEKRIAERMPKPKEAKEKRDNRSGSYLNPRSAMSFDTGFDYAYKWLRSRLHQNSEKRK